VDVQRGRKTERKREIDSESEREIERDGKRNIGIERGNKSF